MFTKEIVVFLSNKGKSHIHIIPTKRLITQYYKQDYIPYALGERIILSLDGTRLLLLDI